jgi:hypothetical protein
MTTTMTRATTPAKAKTAPESGLFWRNPLGGAAGAVEVEEAITTDVTVNVASPETEVNTWAEVETDEEVGVVVVGKVDVALDVLDVL